jgi:hypothetical protein
MRFLIASQHSPLMSAIMDRKQVSNGYQVWADTGEPVEYPISVHEPRERKYVQPQYEYAHTFQDLCNAFPTNVVDDDIETLSPSWGTGFYIEDENGFAKWVKDNFDSSD